MFEYIKRVGLATKLLARKINQENVSLKDMLFREALEFIKLSQNFRGIHFDISDLKTMRLKVLMLIDVVDFARVDNTVGKGDAVIFNQSLTTFLHHLDLQISQVYSYESSMDEVKSVSEYVSRKLAKENSQAKYSYTNVGNNFSFTPMPETEEVYEEVEAPNVFKNTVQKEVKKSEILYTKKAPKGKTRKPKTKEEKEAAKEENKQELLQRKNSVLVALSNGGGSLGDIASKMKGVKEKTIQRDLLTLMREKKVVMVGKKRWARYYVR